MEQTNHGSSVKKRCKPKQSSYSKHNPDLISALPDSLLLHILSFLDMKEVLKTSLLSERWRYLWKSIPCLCFESDWRFFPRTKFSKFVGRCLFHHGVSKINKLHIKFDYLDKDAPAHLIDSWIYFAIRCKVEDFKLRLFGRYLANREYKELYKIPPSLYFCGTLTSLTLCACNLNLPDSFQLGSLKKLSLQHLELHIDSIEHLSSSCPLLEDIYLINCNRNTDLNIFVTNQHVKRLEISEYTPYEYGTIRMVKINAPTLLSLRIYRCCPKVRFHVEELGSLMSADIISQGAFSYFHKDICLDEPGGNYLAELLSDLGHVQLRLCSWCMKVLSVRSIRSLDLLSISATCIELQSRLEKWELPGVIYLLKCCSNLEKLKITYKDSSGRIQLSCEFIYEHYFEEDEYWESLETDIPSSIQKIKTIEIHNALEDSVNEEFVRFLLKNAKVLEKLVINPPKKYGVC